MFRVCLAQGSRSLPSSSQCTSSFHTSTFLNAQTSRGAAARAVKRSNNTHKEERWRKTQASRPSAVLGTRPGDNTTWQNSTLAKILVDEKALLSNAVIEPTKIPIGTVRMPTQVGYGVGEAEKRLLFEKLPALAATVDIKTPNDVPITQGGASLTGPERELSTYIRNRERELRKANMFAQLLDLRNANAGGIAYENRRRIIAAFSTPSNPFDTGRTEVQAALLTYQIRNVWNHLTTFKRDVGNRRGLRKLVHQRAKILKYLKRKDQDRYEAILDQLALKPESVEGELVV